MIDIMSSAVQDVLSRMEKNAQWGTGSAGACPGEGGREAIARRGVLSPRAFAIVGTVEGLRVERTKSQSIEEAPVRVCGRVGRREELLAVEDRIGPGQEAEGLRLVAHRLPAGGEPDERARHQDPGDRDR